MTAEVKICGITAPDAAAAALAAGARWLGFVFYPRSPRAVAPMVAAELVRHLPTTAHAVALFVDPRDDEIEQVIAQVPIDLIQLHGAETPARVAEVRARFLIPVMKAVRIGTAADLTAAAAAEPAADRLLFDARPPRNVAMLPGGNGVPFDWRLLVGHHWSRPWMLAGGLTPETVAEAIAVTGAPAVDVSSGVESRPGHKDPALIRRFMAAVAAAAPSDISSHPAAIPANRQATSSG